MKPITARTRAPILVAVAASWLAPAALQAAPASAPPHVLPPGHPVTPPGSPYSVYVVPVQPRDDRTPRQKCWDAESARVGQPLTDLDRRTIDLKCSQR